MSDKWQRHANESDREWAARQIHDLIADRAAAVELVRELRDALLTAAGTIRIWHGLGHGEKEPQVWAAYQESPEMVRLGNALARADAFLGEPAPKAGGEG